MKYTVVCVTRDFEYINEWIEHYLNLGFDRVIVYDNMSETPVNYVHNKVDIRTYSGMWGGDYECYRWVAKELNNEIGWCLYIDEDEFLNTKGLTIQEAMKPFLEYDSLGLNWRIFGDRVDKESNSTKLVDKYRYFVPESWTNTYGFTHIYIKSIVKNGNIVRFIDPHFAVLKHGKINRTVNGEIVTGSVTKTRDTSSSMWIDHYHFRGLDNYIKRQSRKIPGRKTRTVEELTGVYNTNNPIATEYRHDKMY